MGSRVVERRWVYVPCSGETLLAIEEVERGEVEMTSLEELRKLAHV